MRIRVTTWRHVFAYSSVITALVVAVPLTIVSIALGTVPFIPKLPVLIVSGLIPFFVTLPLSIFALHMFRLINQTVLTLDNLVKFDPLTGVLSRARFLQLVEQNRRTGNYLTILDADFFKKINDTHGHEAGDKVLKQNSQRLVTCVRESDTVARMGDDEYVVLLPIIDSANDAYLVASKIVDEVIKPITIEKISGDTSVIVNVSASIGIAIYPQHGKDEKLLLINADMAMYQAKSNGKNQAKVFDTAILN